MFLPQNAFHEGVPVRAGLLLVFSEVDDSFLPDVEAWLREAHEILFISLSMAASGVRGQSRS